MRLKTMLLVTGLLVLGACESGRETASTQGHSVSRGESAPPGDETAVPRAGTQSTDEWKVTDRVFFDFDSSELKPEARTAIEVLAVSLHQNRDLALLIEGHGDERGTREYNLALGERRAHAVRDYLVSLGIDPGRLSTVSYGEERPVVLGSSELAWAQNRRSAFVLD